VLLSDNDDVVQAVPAKGSDRALAVGILPRGPRGGEDLLDSHRMHSTNEVRAIDFVSVSDDILRSGVVGKGVDQLLACPLRGRTLGDVEVASETLKPSMSNSPWMRGAPQVGFSRAIRRMSIRISASIRGRPLRLRLFQVQ